MKTKRPSGIIDFQAFLELVRITALPKVLRISRKMSKVLSQFGKQVESDKMRAHDYEINTERLLLRPMTVADADAVWKWVSDDRFCQKRIRYYSFLFKSCGTKSRIWTRDGEMRSSFCRIRRIRENRRKL